MLLGVIADDFTGASDIGNTLAKGIAGERGLNVSLFLGVPAVAAPAGVEAGVVALKTRTMPVAQAVSESLAALKWLQAQGCGQFVFKYCSTFDSTPQGNIGPVGEALAEALGASAVIACPAFPTAGRTIYQGHLFVGDRLLNESGMQHHPLTPMTDPDLRRWLGLQSRRPVGLLAHSTVRQGVDAVRARLDTLAGEGQGLVVADAITDADLLVLGQACANDVLLTGGSGIALGLPHNFIAKGMTSATSTSFAPVSGAEAILAGSCSGATRHQVDLHTQSHPALLLDVEALGAGVDQVAAALAFVEANTGRKPLVYSSAPPDQVERLQARFGREKLAALLDGFFADLAQQLVARGTTRLVVAGGETSGAVASALALGALAIGPEIDPGVPLLFAGGATPLALALKSGNFGAPDFFAKALDRMER